MTIKKKHRNNIDDFGDDDDYSVATDKRNMMKQRRPVRNLKKFWIEHGDEEDFDEKLK